MKCQYCSCEMSEAESTHPLYGPEQYCASCVTENLMMVGYTDTEAMAYYEKEEPHAPDD